MEGVLRLTGSIRPSSALWRGEGKGVLFVRGSHRLSSALF